MINPEHWSHILWEIIIFWITEHYEELAGIIQ